MFQNLSLRAVSLILAFFVLCAAVLVAYGGTFVLKKAELLKSEWQTFEGVRSEEARLESRLRSAIGFGGMIHEFKNFVIRKEPRYLDAALGKLYQARSVLEEYKKLNLPNSAYAALEDISEMLQLYELGMHRTRALSSEGRSTLDIDRNVKVDDGPALRALSVLHGLSGNNEINTYDMTTKPLLVNALWAHLGYGGMIHNFKNFVLRGDDRYVTAFKSDQGMIKDALIKLKGLPLNPGEQAAVVDIENNPWRFADALQKARALWDGEKPPDAVDAAIRFDDARALRALRILDAEVAATLQAQGQAISQTLNNIIATTKVLIVVILFALIAILSGSYLFVRNSMMIPLRRISMSMGELCAGNLDASIGCSPSAPMGRIEVIA